MRPLFVLHNEIDTETKVCKFLDINLKPSDVVRICGQPGEPTPEDAWSRIISSQDMFIEYLDPYEEEQALIATSVADVREERDIIEKFNTWRVQRQTAGSGKAMRALVRPARLPRAYTHMELHPALMLSAIAAIIPFPDHN